LEGSGDAGYIVSMAHACLSAGFVTHRFHMRTCGGTGHLTTTLYHAGLTGDLRAFLSQREPSVWPVFLVGFSLGGNVVLKLAGEMGDTAQELMAGVCAVSTPIDLAASAKRIAQRDNRFYERRFVRRMRARVLATGRYREEQFRDAHSIYAIDDSITAPSLGFGTADHYYETQSAARFLDRIRVPTLLIQAKDDTFIPFASFDHDAFRSNPYLTLLATEHGGHVGFLQRHGRRFWLDDVVREWIETRLFSGSKHPAVPL
jgi:predicted alpha/beta-fold hydrolase